VEVFECQSVLLGDNPLETHTSNFIFQLNTCHCSPYVTSFLTRGWVLSFTIAAGPRQRSHSPAEFMTTFYCLIFDTPPTWRAKSPYLYPAGTEWPGYTPGHWVPFSSPATNRRATVEVFEPASKRNNPDCQESDLLYGWRFTAAQLVSETNFLRLTVSNFIFQLNACCYCTSSLTTGWVCSLQLLPVLASAVILRSLDCQDSTRLII
jgi:hypothetical protein